MTNKSKKKTLYFHIGAHKTATSYMQNLLRQNRQGLRDQRIEYYGRCTHKKLTPGDTIHQGFDERLKEFENDSSVDTLIVSDEDLSHNVNNIAYDLIDKYHKNFDIIIICYIREIVSYYISFYSFASKSFVNKESLPPYRNFIEYLDQQKSYISLYHLLSKLTQLLPSENIIVRPFDKNFFRNQKIENDFFDILNVDARSFEFINRKNISPSLKQAEKIYYALTLTNNRDVRGRLRERVLASKEGVKSTITKEELDAIYERYREYEIKMESFFLKKTKENDGFGKTYKQWSKEINNTNKHALNDDEKRNVRDIVNVAKRKVFLLKLIPPRFQKLLRKT